MLTRLKVSGFKSLVDVDVRFGPFTCIAGANGSGKSNLFDAILFLSALADKTLAEAAFSVRVESKSAADLSTVFHRSGETRASRIRMEAEMILPRRGRDDLGAEVEATSTLVRYVVELGWRTDRSEYPDAGPLELIEERLVSLPIQEINEHLCFPTSKPWRDSVLRGSRKREFISMGADSDSRVVQLHQDGRSGRKFRRPAKSLPRTVLSSIQAEYPTAMLVRREMQSWRLLQLESRALRMADSFDAPTRLGADGSHLPSALYHLSRRSIPSVSLEVSEASVYSQVANRLGRLIDDVQEVWVARSDAQRTYTLKVRSRDGTVHAAHALSDGTLRFLALAVKELDHDDSGLLCLEEPENGIHPQRVSAMLQLLQDMAVDTDFPADKDNPLRQVLVNTHSPILVQQVPDDALLVAEWVEGVSPGHVGCLTLVPADDGSADDGPSSAGLDDGTVVRDGWSASSMPCHEGQHPRESRRHKTALDHPVRYRQTVFGCLGGTWRADRCPGARVVTRGTLVNYLNPAVLSPEAGSEGKRVMDREELQMLLFQTKE